ncbi:DEAD/DEAH box helicase [Merdibacter massiliensis]|uniref:DEAD/DEAH box helicase n=1 Tax=Merdibacter massiliensis TaxID=1871030 RepID=UPI00096A9AB9|nr:SNF2-related protein [Merdibacter massiliensis]
MRILSTEIEELSKRQSNYASASRMQIQDMLRSLSIEEQYGHLFVHGSLIHGGHLCNFELEISAYGEILDHYCSCPYHEKEDACGHIIALCQYLALREYKLPYHLDVADEQRKRWKDYKEQLHQIAIHQKQKESHQWLYSEGVKQFSFEEPNKEKKSISLYLDLNQTISLHGNACIVNVRIRQKKERLYVVRDLYQFLDHIQNEAFHSYGKGLQFVHSIEAFDDASQSILYFLRYLYLHSQTIMNHRSFLLKGQEMDALVKLLLTLPKEYCNYRVIKKTIQLHLQLSVQKSHTQIALLYAADENGRIISNPLSSKQGLYEMDESEKVLYHYQGDDDGLVLNLYHELMQNKELLLDQSDLSQFYYTYLCGLSAYIQWQGNLSLDSIAVLEDAVHLYLDMDESQNYLCAKLMLLYKDRSCSAFTSARQNVSFKAIAIKEYLIGWIDHMGEDGTAYLKNEEHWSDMIEKITHALQDYCQIYVSDRLRRIRRPRQLSMSVGVHVENNLLSLQLDTGDIDLKELSSILKSYRRKKKYYRLRNGEMLDLNSEPLKEANTLFEQLHISEQQLQEESIVLPSYRLYNLGVLSDEQKQVQYDQKTILHQQKELMKQREPFAIPDAFHHQLRDYQKTGFQWLKTLSSYGFGGLLADDMGLGKTIQILAYLKSEQDKEKQSLVICPASLLLNWQDEAKRFVPSLICAPIYGNKQERMKRLKNADGADLIITSYDYLKRDLDLYLERSFDTVILDEAQYINNPSTKNARSVKKLRCRQRFALSGTPIENTLTELWSIFDFLLPGYLYDHSYFSSVYEKAIVKEQDEHMTMRLQQLVRPFLLRRTKQEVLKELPDKEEHTLFFEFEKKEKELYLANATRMREQIEKESNARNNSIEILSLITRLRQLCLDDRLVYENIEYNSSKLRGCMELIQNCIRAKKKILLFSSFTSMLDLLKEELDKEGISYYLLTGSLAKEKRHSYVEKFQKDDTPVFLISLKAGGTGLNLTAAEVVIHFDPWWNLSAQNQATDRAYRIGQHNNVQVYQLIMKGTIEERIQELQNKKKDLADLFVSTQSDNLLRSMSREELLSLFE